MAAEGVELMADMRDLAVMGFVEVLARLPFFLRLRKRVFRALEEEGVDLVIPVDYPGFNLRLARHATGRGIPVLYYIAPQVWAWHASRARDLARDTSRIAVILPFEEEFLRKAGATVEFVGHPLLEEGHEPFDRQAWLQSAGFRSDRPLLALFPGSRAQEIGRHLALFTAAAARVHDSNPDVQVAIGAPGHVEDGAYSGSDLPICRDPHGLLASATAALVKSGTTTLEAALLRTPAVVAYRMNPLSFILAKRLVKVPHIALPNLVAGRRIVPELVQDQADPETLARELAPLLDTGDPQRQAMVEAFGEVREKLRKAGAGERVAEIAADLLGRARLR